METAPNKKFFLFRWIDVLTDFGGGLASISLAGLTIVVVLEILLRFLFNAPTIWVGEMSVYLCMACGLLGAAYALRMDMHFGITIIIDRISAKTRRRMRILTNSMGLVYAMVLLIKGFQMAQFSYEMEDVSTGLMATPLWIPNLLIPLAGLLLALQFINKLAEDFSNKNPG